VPILPASFRKSSEMDALKMMLLSTDYASRVGFFGIGGSGKEF
jgi:hypothetical protein